MLYFTSYATIRQLLEIPPKESKEVKDPEMIKEWKKWRKRCR
jgi:hypothetical protein